MNSVRYLVLIGVLLGNLLSAVAQGPDDQYIQIYAVIQEADALGERGQSVQATAKYLEAQTALQRFQKGYPEFDADVVKFRLNYIASKLEALGPKADTAAQAVTNTAPAETAQAVVPPNVQAQHARLNEQIRQLLGDKALLEAKLKEALAAQPAAVDPRELANADEKIRVLQKENELLKTGLAQERAKAAPAIDTNALARAQATLEISDRELAQQKEIILKLTSERDALQVELKKAAAVAEVGAKSSQNVADLNQQLAAQKETIAKLELEKQALQARVQPPAADNNTVAALKARLAALEAQAVPYTSEELALFKEPPPQLVNIGTTNTTKPSKPLSASAAKLVAEARREFSGGNYEKAEKKFQQVLKEDPQNPMALTDVAVIQMQLRRLDSADNNLKQAVAAAPENAYALSTLGHLRFLQGKYDEAVETLSRAAQLDPKNAEIQNRLGVALSQKGQRAPAETALRKALQLDPNYGEAHQNLAVVYATQKPPMLELARFHYQKSLSAGAAKNAELEKLLENGKTASK